MSEHWTTEPEDLEEDLGTPVRELRRPGYLLAAITGVVGALVGAVVAGLIVLVALGDDNGDAEPGADVVSTVESAAMSSAEMAAEVVSEAPAQTTAESKSATSAGVPNTALADDSDDSADSTVPVLSPATDESAESEPPAGQPSELGSTDLAESDPEESDPEDSRLDEFDPDELVSYWTRLLNGELGEAGDPLGSRIEGINVRAVLEAVQESVVIVKTPTGENPDGGGSGFVVSADGHIITNEHVVRDAETVEVRLFGGALMPAEVVASDPTRDLAVLKVEREGLPAARLGSTEGVEVGDEVIAIGNAFGIVGEPTVTAGIVSGLNRDIELADNTRLVRLIQTDAAINPGNSGGPLVNAAGEVIGVNTAIRSGFAEGIGYAISIDHARPIIDQLLEGVVQAKAYLGVTVTSVENVLAPADSEETEDIPETVEPGSDPEEQPPDVELPPSVTFGALVVSVDAGQAAQRAGIEVGDVIIEFEGTEVRTSAGLVVEILARVPGDRVQMRVVGLDGKVRTVELVLGSFPDEQ